MSYSLNFLLFFNGLLGAAGAEAKDDCSGRLKLASKIGLEDI